ncbi:ferric reductase-like transmembrane domain-containing protein [Amycolatopsis thermoflava]|uniref:ferric reductase-like transmembrane domain-containing protein n=1 Tax=Amycolatopsis thermoflava TaxID=84480 RepID=UPI003D727140
MSTDALWDFGRGTGVVALVLVTVSVVLGILTRRGEPVAGLPRFAVTEVHRNASLLSVVFLALHVGLLLFDPYAQLRIFDLVVPFAGDYRPFWQGLGTVALDLLVALVVTSLLRQRLGRRTWRAVHWLAYAMWPVAVAHSLGTGTDAFSAWFLAIAAVCVAAVLGATGWRFTRKELVS